MSLSYLDQIAAQELLDDALRSFDKDTMLSCLSLFEQLHTERDYDSDILENYINFIERRLHTLFGPNWSQ